MIFSSTQNDSFEPFPRPSLTHCDQEPIHVPGSIQNFGVFLALDHKDCCITNISENACTFFERSATQMVGKPISTLLSGNGWSQLETLIRKKPNQEAIALNWVPNRSHGISDKISIVTWTDQGILIDIEPHKSSQPTALESENPWALPQAALGYIAELSRCGDLASLFHKTTLVIKQLTGYDRVMLYQFDRDFNGSVVAETKEPHLETFLGLHYPSSDIPAQARALYQKNLVRQIPSVAHVASSVLIPQGWNGVANHPVDLSLSTLRSVSPIHIEYLGNMGVEATLVCSVVIQDTLWGLVSCHNYSTKFVAHPLRKICEVVCQTVASRIHSLEALEQSEGSQQALQAIRQVMKAVRGQAEQKGIFEVLGEFAADLQSICQAQGMCLWTPQTLTLFGKTPSPSAIGALVQWLGSLDFGTVFSTDRITQLFPSAAHEAGVGSGVMAVKIAGSRVKGGAQADQFIVWFANEWQHSVTWGGDPTEHLKAINEAPHIRLSPRKSFEKWKSNVKGQSRPWSRKALHAATVLCHELTEHSLRNSEARLRENEKMLFQAQRAETVGILTSGVAHDFNNLLTAIRGFAERAISDPNRAPSDMAKIMKCSERGTALIHQLLQLAKHESANESDLEIQLKDVLEEAGHLMERLLKKDMEIQISSDPTLPSVKARPLALLQILMNLATNARDAMLKGGQLKIHASLDPQPGWVKIEVTDNGPGIPQDILPRIFEPFFSTRQKGVGMGLSMVKRLTTLSGGHIDVHSVLGRGTTFTLRLGIYNAQRTPHATTLVASQSSSRTVPQTADLTFPSARLPKERLVGKRVLVAEDEADLCDLTAFFLSQEGAEVTTSQDGFQALSAYLTSAQPPDALVLDVKMPRLGGAGAYQELLKWGGRRIPTLFVSGDPEDSTHLPQDPWVGWLQKPYGSADIINALQKLLINCEAGS